MKKENQAEMKIQDREHTRTGLSKEALRNAYIDNLFYVQGRFREVATANDMYMAAAYTVRDRLLERWLKTAQTYKDSTCTRGAIADLEQFGSYTLSSREFIDALGATIDSKRKAASPQ